MQAKSAMCADNTAEDESDCFDIRMRGVFLSHLKPILQGANLTIPNVKGVKDVF